MRTRWTNLILHTTALIAKKKRDLTVSHAFAGIANVILIVFLEIFLAVVSLPLYFAVEQKKLGKASGYSMRRVITVSSAVALLFIWSVKIVLVVGIPLYFDAKQTSDASVRQSLESSVLFGAYAMRSDPAADVPSWESITETCGDRIIMRGAGRPDTHVIAVVSKADESETLNQGSVLYAAGVGENGEWAIETDTNALALRPGAYYARLMSYDVSERSKSVLSDTRYFEVRENEMRKTIRTTDRYLNYAIIAVLLAGVASVILLA